MEKSKAVLLLEDGSVYKGWSLNKKYTSSGEIVFNTGMTGYQEILTDPSYSGQIINFCYTEFGNNGTNFEDNESTRPLIKGIIIREISEFTNNWRKNLSIIEFMEQYNIPLIYGIDTRQLTKKIRKSGSMNCILSNQDLDPLSLMAKLQKVPHMQGLNLAEQASAKKNYSYQMLLNQEWYSWKTNFTDEKKRGEYLNIIIIDFGVKSNIAECIGKYSCRTHIITYKSNINDIQKYKPDGIILSNGPGDPAMLTSVIPLISTLIKMEIPIFGICMGHQLLSLALGYETFKLKFGHRGLNHPCGIDQKSEITSQNHGFATKYIISDLMTQNDHLNLNDNTIAGLSHNRLPIFSVQYHPEASPGPHDTEYLFKHFIEIVKNDKIKRLQLTINNQKWI